MPATEDTNMMLDWNEYRKQLAAGVKQVGQLSADTGATEEEIAEALGVAVAMNAGAALVYSTRVLDAALTLRSVAAPGT